MIKNFIPEGVSDLNNDEYEKIRSVAGVTDGRVPRRRVPADYDADL